MTDLLFEMFLLGFFSGFLGFVCLFVEGFLLLSSFGIFFFFNCFW